MNSSSVTAGRGSGLFPGPACGYTVPPLFVGGEMQYLFDDRGKCYTDFFADVSVMIGGHSNPFMLERMKERLENLPPVTPFGPTAPAAELAEKISEAVPINGAASFFYHSGSEANDGALLLARRRTGRPGVVALEGGSHGRTFLTTSVTRVPLRRADPFPYPDVSFIPNAPDEEAARRSLSALEDLLNRESGKYAALIAEVIQGEAGIVAPPEWYFRELHPLLKKYGVLLIADETQTGFARTGAMFACEKYGVTPDIITYADALGNGVPIGGFSAAPETGGGAFIPSAALSPGGNPVAATAALAVLDYFRRENLCERAEKRGEVLKGCLLDLRKKFPVIREVRGMGLMLGAELCGGEGEPLPRKADAVWEAMKDGGFIIGKSGVRRNVLAFRPPLVIAEEDIFEMTEALEKALA